VKTEQFRKLAGEESELWAGVVAEVYPRLLAAATGAYVRYEEERSTGFALLLTGSRLFSLASRRDSDVLELKSFPVATLVGETNLTINDGKETRFEFTFKLAESSDQFVVSELVTDDAPEGTIPKAREFVAEVLGLPATKK
jgi:hypothetical protein